MTTSMVMEMNLGENGGAKQQSTVNGGGGGGGGRRRRTKGGELNQRKNKLPQRGMGVEQLERLRLQEGWKKMTEVPSHTLHPFTLPAFSSSVAFTTPCSTTTAAVQFRPVQQAPAPVLYHGIGIHGTSLFSTEHVMDSSVIGSSNAGFRFENSIPNYVKCVSDGCGVCHKKKRIHGGSNACSVNPFRNLAGNSSIVETIDTAKNRRQVTEVMSVHRSGGGAMTEYEFFPGKGGISRDDVVYKEFMRLGTPTWCGSGSTSVGGASTGLRGGDRSCVTALTGNEEGSVSSVDLSLKL